MIKSMTGYGAAERNGYKVEVRSLNHKYLDVSVRMPSYLMEHEINMRKLVRESFERGKVDVTVSQTDKRRKKICVDADLARDMHKAFSEIKKELLMPGELDISFFSGFREVLMSEEPEEGAEHILEALKEALSRADEMRRAEGGALGQDLRQRLATVEGSRKGIMDASAGVMQAIKEKLTKRVAELVATAPDETRMAQEIAFIAQKADISEELSRLDSHLRQFAGFLDKPASIGRRLDFLCQEMNREANTIGSKTDDVNVINLALDIKSELEKIREQVQNVQ